MDNSITKYIENTLLKPDMTYDLLYEFIVQSLKYDFHSLCIPPGYVRDTKDIIENTGQKCNITTVVGFPHGLSPTIVKAYEAENVINNGANEIDAVINISELKSGNYQYILNELKTLRKICRGKILKIIIETAYLDNNEKKLISKLILDSECDYVKTSTGFAPKGAVIEDIVLIKEATDNLIKIKASGGIHNLIETKLFIDAGASLIGTSKGIEIAQET